ncbi:MAG: hypothetical protein ACXABU_08330 [Candidatus Hodarchaeales archaeon]
MPNGKSNPIDSIHLQVEDRSFGFFIYFYDELQGHSLLFTYPKALMENENERAILTIHPAWWHQDQFLKSDKFSTMDLELSGVVYSATLFECDTQRLKKRSGMKAMKWQKERFILIVKAPSEVSFVAQEILHEFYSKIKEDFSKRLCYLVRFQLESSANKLSEDFSLKNARLVEEELTEICQSLTPNTPISKLEPLFRKDRKREKIVEVDKNFLSKSVPKKKLRFAIPRSKDSKVIGQSKTEDIRGRQKTIKILSINRGEDLVAISLKNTSPFSIKNVTIRIYESRGFFGKDKALKKLEKWDQGEVKGIDFIPEIEDGIRYLLKIEDEEDTLKIKRI